MAIDIEAIKKKVAKLQGDFSSSRVQQWKPAVGNYVIRALPWKDQAPESPFKELWFYYIDGLPTILAPFQFNKPDPIHEFRQQLFASGKPEDRKIAKELRPKMRSYAPIVILDGEGADPNKVIVFAMGKNVYERMLSFFLKRGVGDYLDPKNGFDLEVTITQPEGKMYRNTTVDLTFERSPVADSDEKIKALLDSVPDISGMYPLREAAEIDTLLQKWLNGDVANNEPGTSRNVAKTDELDKLANEISDAGDSSSSSTEEMQEDDDAAAAPVAKKSSKKQAKKVETKTQDLDSAFDELMSDD